MKGNKWILVLAALVIMAATWLGTDTQQLQQLSAGDLIPVLVVSAVIFLLKTGALSAVLLFLKKTLDHFRKK
jgi:hypothetical protein